MKEEEIFVFTVSTFPYSKQKYHGYQRKYFPPECKDDDIVKVFRTGGFVRLVFMKAKTYERFHSSLHTFPFVVPRDKKPKKQPEDERQEVMF